MKKRRTPLLDQPLDDAEGATIVCFGGMAAIACTGVLMSLLGLL